METESIEKRLIEKLESKLHDGFHIEFEGVYWVLYSDDGEGFASGTTLYQMLLDIEK